MEDKKPEVPSESESNDLSEYDKHYLSTISTSIRRARALLLSIGLVAAWLFTIELTDLLGWSGIRTPASYNIEVAADSMLRNLNVKVPVSSLRPSDRVNYLRNIDSLYKNTDYLRVGSISITCPQKKPTVSVSNKPNDSTTITTNYPSKESTLSVTCPREETTIAIPYPNKEKLFAEKVDWCQHYYPFILNQEQDSIKIAMVQVLLDRGKMSDTKLPQEFIQRPKIEVPIVGLSVSLDDISVIGAIILMFGMIWFKLSLETVLVNIKRVQQEFPSGTKKGKFFEVWLPMQFLLIERMDSPAGKPSPLAYPLFFVPYVAVLSALLVDFHDIVWQVAAYTKVTHSTFPPMIPLFTDVRSFFLSEAMGIFSLRFAVLIIIVFLMYRQARNAWKVMAEIIHVSGSENPKSGEPLNSNGGQRGHSKRYWWITVIPILVVFSWIIGRLFSIFTGTLDMYGWTYGPNFIGSLVILTMLLILLKIVFTELKSKSSSDKESNLDSSSNK